MLFYTLLLEKSNEAITHKLIIMQMNLNMSYRITFSEY